jgi:hypothetical protein
LEGQSQSVSVVKTLVCLANSRKLAGRCVAGREWLAHRAGGWIRPVSARPSEEVSEYERQYEDGSDPQLLDIIDVPLLAATPNPIQPENWLLDPERYWRRVGHIGVGDLNALCEDPPILWRNGASSSNGINDRIAASDAANLGGSLSFLRLASVRLTVYAPGSAFGNSKRRVQAYFAHRRVNYSLWVTDPVVERKLLAGADGRFTVGDCFATISVGEPYDGYCYKFVAALITPERARS